MSSGSVTDTFDAQANETGGRSQESQANLPLGWEKVALAAVVPNPRTKVAPDPNSDLPFIGMDDIESETTKLISQDQFSNMRSAGSWFQCDDVLYGRLRPYLNKVHCAKFDGVASAEFIVIPSSCAVDSRFLTWLMSSRRFVEFSNSKASGDRPRVKFQQIGKFEFGLPPLGEQRRIVDKIETLFARIDKGEEALRHTRKLIKRYRQSVLNAAVTGELTRDWREANRDKLEPASELLERILEKRRAYWEGRGNYKEPVTPNVGNQSSLPNGWTWSTTEQLTFVQTGATPKKSEGRYYTTDGVNWITSTAVNEDPILSAQACITEAAIEETNAKVFPKGSLIVAMYGEGKTRGKVSELGIDSATNQACAALLIGHVPAPVSRYLKLYYQYNYEIIRRQSAGGVQPNLSLAHIREMLVPLPPIDEIVEILKRANEQLSQAENLQQFCVEELNRSDALRQSILKSAFSGQLVPEDPNDEPASELLARIREEREAAPKSKPRKKAARKKSARRKVGTGS